MREDATRVGGDEEIREMIGQEEKEYREGEEEVEKRRPN